MQRDSEFLTNLTRTRALRLWLFHHGLPEIFCARMDHRTGNSHDLHPRHFSIFACISFFILQSPFTATFRRYRYWYIHRPQV